MELIIFNILIIVFLLYSIKELIDEYKKIYETKEVNIIIRGALLGLVISTFSNVLSKTIVMIIDSIGG